MSNMPTEALCILFGHYTGLFISPSGISELDCATTKTDTAERSISTERERETLQNWRDSLPIDMLLSAVSVLVVAQSSSEIPEGLMNNTVYRFSTNAQYGYYFFLPWRNSPQLCQGQLIIEVSRSLSDTPH